MFHYITNDKLVDEHTALRTFHNSHSPFFSALSFVSMLKMLSSTYIFFALFREGACCVWRGKKRGHWTTCWQAVICSQNYGMLFHFFLLAIYFVFEIVSFSIKIQIHCLEWMSRSINQTLSKNFRYNNHFSIKFQMKIVFCVAGIY